MLFIIIMWAIVGLVVGGLGRLLVPGRNTIGIALTILIGIVGAIAGGSVTRALMGAGHDVVSFIVSLVIAAILVAAVSGPQRLRARRRWR
ncbi:MAG TPA: hypothetical protein VKS82_24375 [Streptosporangiaceae bacterium]|jgi:uncharacterized membrane protein YeaQ/YmgE (transglycosylase-associated protein family)|nr:hypothetical protein [Streptosporangiaceae bacterium]